MRRFRDPARPRLPVPGVSHLRPLPPASSRIFLAIPMASLLALGACAPLPPAYMIAAQALDGVSYAATGKGGADHLLSAALDEDCALHRVVTGIAVCQAESTEGQQVASLDAVSEPAAEVAAPLAPATGDSVLVAAGFGADMFFAPHVGAPEAVRVAPAPAPAPMPEQAALPEAAPVADPVPASAGEPRYFVVLGSFARKDNAARAAAAAGAGARVAEAVVAGRTYYRVVSGPFDRRAGIAARDGYVRAGFAGAWPAPACANGASGGCVAAQ